MRKLAFAGIFLLLVGGAVLLGYSNFKKIEKRPTGGPFLDTIVVGASTKSVANAIVKTFNDGHLLGFSAPNKFSRQEKFHYFFLWNRKDSIFPDDIQLAFHVSRDPALRRYSELPANARSADFYLYEPSGDYYWLSEYFANGARAKFRCAFIIHLEPLSSAKTKVEVLEYLPEIWVGKVFDPMGHSGPGFYYDIREVGPTESDRTELLEIIRHAVLLSPAQDSTSVGSNFSVIPARVSGARGRIPLIGRGEGPGFFARQPRARMTAQAIEQDRNCHYEFAELNR